MATCTIAQREVFSRDYGNFWARGYDVDALIARVEELLADARPELIWWPHTGEMCVEHTSLRAARAENPVDEIEELMTGLWEQAAREQQEAMTTEQREFCKMVDRAGSINEVVRLQRQKKAITRSVRDIAAAAGLSYRKMAERFFIPYRTMEDWSAGKSACPVYTRLMMQECLGMYNPTDTE